MTKIALFLLFLTFFLGSCQRTTVNADTDVKGLTTSVEQDEMVSPVFHNANGEPVYLMLISGLEKADLLDQTWLSVTLDPLLSNFENVLQRGPARAGGGFRGHIYTNDLNIITGFSDLEFLHLRVLGFEYANFSPLSELKKLEGIRIEPIRPFHPGDPASLGSVRIPPITFPDLSGIKNLKNMELDFAWIQTLSSINEKLPNNIEHIAIIVRYSNVVDLSDLNKITSLRSFVLNHRHGSWESEYSFMSFYGMNNLETLVIDTSGHHASCPEQHIIDFEGIESLSSLKSLSVPYASMTNIHLLANVTTLEILELGIMNETVNFEFLKNLINLRELRLVNQRGNEFYMSFDVSLIKELSKLEYLHLEGGFNIKNSIIADTMPSLSVNWFGSRLEPDENNNISTIWGTIFIHER